MAEHYLQGGCSCGRNQYEIVLPPPDETRTLAQVLFGESSEIRRAYASALPTLLRVPLPWIQSTTYAYYSDEQPADIRRVFTPRSAPHTKRNFCGFCGVPLTFWSEETQDEANFICVNLGSLEKKSVDLLDMLGVLPTAADVGEDGQEEGLDVGAASQGGGNLEPQGESSITSAGQKEVRGQPWFEELIENGPLGQIKRRRGGKKSQDGRTVVEWEVIEMDGGDDGTETPTKRQMTSFEMSSDIRMHEA